MTPFFGKWWKFPRAPLEIKGSCPRGLQETDFAIIWPMGSCLDVPKTSTTFFRVPQKKSKTSGNDTNEDPLRNFTTNYPIEMVWISVKNLLYEPSMAFYSGKWLLRYWSIEEMNQKCLRNPRSRAPPSIPQFCCHDRDQGVVEKPCPRTLSGFFISGRYDDWLLRNWMKSPVNMAIRKEFHQFLSNFSRAKIGHIGIWRQSLCTS